MLGFFGFGSCGGMVGVRSSGRMAIGALSKIQSQRAVMPPSTTISVPVMKRASSEAKNNTAAAVSRPSPMNPSGMRATRDLSKASTSPPVRCLARRASTMGVCIWPGITVFTRIPFLAYCTAVTRENWITAALAAALRDHHRNDVAAGKKNALEIVVDLPVERFFRHFRDAARGRAADIVDEN